MPCRRALTHLVKIAAFCAAFLVLDLAGCDDTPELPPEDDAPKVKAVEIDLKHSAEIKADRTFAIANLVLVLQPDPIVGGQMGVTLTCARPGADGSRLIFGTFEHADTIDELAKTDIDFAGPAVLDPRDNGIFTPLGSYMPKLVRMRITSHDKDQAEGTIRGDFYRFKPAEPTLHPPIVQVDAAFSAKLVQR